MQGVREDDKVRIQEFDVGTVINYIPANPSAVYRLGGGTMQLFSLLYCCFRKLS